MVERNVPVLQKVEQRTNHKRYQRPKIPKKIPEPAKADAVRTKRSVRKDKAQRVKARNEAQKIPETAKADAVKTKRV